MQAHIHRECLPAAQRRFRNLVAGLESEIVALARRVQSHEQQLSALGVPLPGPYDAGASTHPLLAGGEGMESLPHGERLVGAAGVAAGCHLHAALRVLRRRPCRGLAGAGG